LPTTDVEIIFKKKIIIRDKIWGSSL